MRDFNFFAPYIAKRKPSDNNHIILIISASIIIIFCFSFYMWNMLAINKMNKEINRMADSMSDVKTLDKLKKYNDMQDKINKMNQYMQAIVVINDAVERKDVINSKYLELVNSTMPQNLFLQSIKINVTNLELQGISTSQTAIAEYQYNLKKLNLFSDVFVNNISAEVSSIGQANTGNYIFSIKCMMKDGSNNEAK